MWDPDQAIRAELQPGETLRRTGRPALLRVLPANAYGILFMLFWEGMVLSGTLTVRELGRNGERLTLAGVPDVRLAAEAIERLRADGWATLEPANLLRGL